MATPVGNVVTKTEKVELEPNTDVALKARSNDVAKEEQVAVKLEPKSGVSFPVKLNDRNQLTSVGLMKKTILLMDIKVFGFGIYADNQKLKELLRSKIRKAPEKPTKEMYQMVIDSDVEMTVRIVFVFSGTTMSLLKSNICESLGAAIKKLTGRKNDELAKRVMGEVSDGIMLTSGSVMEMSRQPGNILQTKVHGEVVSKIESELLCRAHIYNILGDNPFDKDAKENFGKSLLSLLKSK